MKFRSACDVCHTAKVKCSGGRPCENCCRYGGRCIYSVASKQGRPRGTRNKATVERIYQSISQPQSVQEEFPASPLDEFTFGLASLGSAVDSVSEFDSYIGPQEIPYNTYGLSAVDNLPGVPTLSSLQNRSAPSYDQAPTPVSVNDLGGPSPSPECQCVGLFADCFKFANRPNGIHPLAACFEDALLALRQTNEILSKLPGCSACETTPLLGPTMISALYFRFALHRLMSTVRDIPGHDQGPRNSFESEAQHHHSTLPQRPYAMTEDEECMVRNILLQRTVDGLCKVQEILETRGRVLQTRACQAGTQAMDHQYLQHILEDARQFVSELSGSLR